MVFHAITPSNAITNTVRVENALDINGNPANGGADAPFVIDEEPTAAVLRSFTATVSDQAVGFTADVTLQWETITEIDNLGFNLWRSRQQDGNYRRVNRFLIPSQALGTGGARYEFMDRDVPSGTWYYKLETLSTTGQTDSWHGPISVRVEDTPRWHIYLPFVMQ